MRPALIKGTLLVTSTLTVMSGATISPSLPAIQAYFSDVPSVDYWVRLVLTMPALFIVIGAPVAGVLTDSWGRKGLLSVSVVLYGLAGASGVVLDTLWALLAGRALLGLAVAGIMTTVTTLFTDYYEGDERAQLLGLQATFMSLGGVLFLSLGGVLADLSWRFPFLIYLFAFVLLPFIAFALYEPERQTDSGSHAPLSHLPWRLLSIIYGVALVMQVVFYTVPVQLPFYLEQLLSASATQSGLAIAAVTVFSAIASTFYGKFQKRFGFIVILVVSLAVMGAGYMVIGAGSSYLVIMTGLALGGVGLGLMMPNLNTWLSERVPDQLKGRALGGLTLFFFLGQFLSPIATQPLANEMGLALMYIIGGASLISLAVLFALLRQPVIRVARAAEGKS